MLPLHDVEFQTCSTEDTAAARLTTGQLLVYLLSHFLFLGQTQQLLLQRSQWLTE